MIIMFTNNSHVLMFLQRMQWAVNCSEQFLINELTTSFHKHFAKRLAVTQGGRKQRAMRDGSMCISDNIVVLHFLAVIMLILCNLRPPTEKNMTL